MAALGPGAFVVVVGASGVGKDSVLDYVRARVGPTVRFPQRIITRPPGPGECHIPIATTEFELAVERGDFAVWWRAHGLGYGLSIEIDEIVRDGGIVVVNVSRTVLPLLAERYARLRVVRITAALDVRAQRLAGRGRESEAEIRRRLARADPAEGWTHHHEIPNNGYLAESGDHLLRILADLG